MLNCLCASRFGLGWAHDDITVARHMLMHFHAYVPYIQYISIYLNYLELFLLFFSSPFLSLVYISMSWNQNVSLLHPGTLFVLGHRLLLILLLLFYSVLCWGCPKGLLGELFSMRCSFGMPSHFVKLLWHWPTHCHSQPGLGVAVWHLDHMSIHANPGVLLQHAWIWFFSTSISYSRSRYMHSYHTGVGIWCALCPEGRAS